MDRKKELKQAYKNYKPDMGFLLSNQMLTKSAMLKNREI